MRDREPEESDPIADVDEGMLRAQRRAETLQARHDRGDEDVDDDDVREAWVRVREAGER